MSIRMYDCWNARQRGSVLVGYVTTGDSRMRNSHAQSHFPIRVFPRTAPDRGFRAHSIFLLPIAIVIGLFTACQGGTPSQPKSAMPAPERKTESAQTVEETGREAFQKLYATAHMWAPDARPFRLQSDLTKDSTGQGGKAAIWRSGFASAARRSIKTFVWSGSHSEDAPSFGVSSSTEDTYSPSNSSTQVFDFNFLKVDSDKAFEVAQQHGGQKIVKQYPKQPVSYILDWNPRQNILLWHVIYGTAPAAAKLDVAVNASTGAFVRVEK